jgi:hypothetical protein
MKTPSIHHRTLSWPALAEDDLPRGTRACGVAKPIALLVLLEEISKREIRERGGCSLWKRVGGIRTHVLHIVFKSGCFKSAIGSRYFFLSVPSIHVSCFNFFSTALLALAFNLVLVVLR